MIYPNVDVQKWAAEYNLDLKPGRCEKCRKKLSKWLPIATKDFRGVISKPHGCPPEYDNKIYSWVDKERQDFWASVAKMGGGE